MLSPRLPVLLALIAFCVVSRVPSFRASFEPELGGYLWNFSPLLALFVFSGAVYRHWVWAAAAPLAAYFLGDLAVWLASSDVSNAFQPVTAWTYLALCGVLACGWWLRRGARTWPRIALASFGGALTFFLVSNFGSWLMDPWLASPTGYDRSWWGLWQSYVAALPFWRNDLSATLLFSALFFSPAGLAALTEEAGQLSPAVEPPAGAAVPVEATGRT
jgi:hypothetical protein